MGEPYVELGSEAVNYLTENHFDKAWDKAAAALGRKPTKIDNGPSSSGGAQQENNPPPRSAVSGRSNNYPAESATSGRRRKQRNRLPSPEGDEDGYYRGSNRRRDSSLDKESEYSERVIRDYEAERSDPRRKAESVLSKKDINQLRRDSKMSRADGAYGGAGGNLSAYNQQSYGGQRANSAQPPKSRYYDDDEYGSDYDERSGRRYNTTGRGYDDRYDDDGRNYDREIIETERYRGPAGGYQRQQSYGTQGGRGDPYAAGGAMTQYNRRSTTEVDDYRSRRSGSRGRRDRDRRDRDRSRSSSHSSRDRSVDRERGFGDKIGSHFDTSLQGLGVGIAGAVVGGMAGRHVGKDSRHSNRDILLGALIGGLGANAAEHKWKDWSEEKKEKVREDEERFEQRWDGRDYGRSRSAMR